MSLECPTSVLVKEYIYIFFYTTTVINLKHIKYIKGRGSGSFFGGLLIGSYGTRQSFRLMGLLGIISGTVYGLLHCMWLHKFEDRPSTEKSGNFLIKIEIK